MGLREKQTAERKKRILDVADTLIRQTGGTEFSMRMLAQMAEVSPATPYNLFDSKEGILSASLERSLARTIFEGLQPQAGSPLRFVLTASATAANLLTTQKDLLRPLYQYLLGVVDPLHHPLHIARSMAYWRTVAATTLPGLMRRDKQPIADYDTVASLLFAHFLGLLDLWIHEDIGDEVFRARAVYGGLLIVSPFAAAEDIDEIHDLLAHAKADIDKVAKMEGADGGSSKRRASAASKKPA